MSPMLTSDPTVKVMPKYAPLTKVTVLLMPPPSGATVTVPVFVHPAHAPEG